MPGRPRRTAKLLNDLSNQILDCASELTDLMPLQYHERPKPTDPTCCAWHRATDATVEAYRAVAALEEMLLEKVARADRLAGESTDKPIHDQNGHSVIPEVRSDLA